MQSSTLRFWLFSESILVWLLACQPIVAQIIPDDTLPVNSTVTPQGNIRVIEGGTQRGGNLFHSFREFSLATGDTAFFNNDLAVKNLITRITGGLRSDIDGNIRANGTANLFIINPNGIIFGSNASLQIGGSFVASTANSLRFADGTEFSVTATQTTPLLTVSVPIGLQFGSNAGEIVNRSQASPNGVVNSINFPVGLQVLSGKTLALVGGNVALEGGNLTAEGGRIELGSVAEPGLVNLSESETGYALNYTGIQNFRNIQLSNAIVDASGESGGAIQLQGSNINITDASQVFSSTLGIGTGKNLAINATDSVNLSELASLFTDTSGSGAAGNLLIVTRRLIADGGASITASTLGEGRAGDVLVRASDSIELVGTSSNGRFPSGIASQVFPNGTGNGGNLTIETRRLLIKDGAVVDTSTFGAGQAGNVLVTASDSVELVGTGLPFGTGRNDRSASGIFTQVADRAIDNAGNAGNLNIETGRLTILDGAQVSNAARMRGNGGILTINASDSIKLSGSSPVAFQEPNGRRVGSSGIFVSTEPGAMGQLAGGNVGRLNITTELLTVENGAEISANNSGTSDGGTATLNVRQLIIRDGGRIGAGSFGSGSGGALTVNVTDSVQVMGTGTISSNRIPVTSTLSVSSTRSGLAGNLEVKAGSIELDNSGRISADTTGGGGDITVTSPSLIMRRNSSITTNAEGSDIPGGNITLNTDVLAALENSDISANSEEFQGGNVTINAQAIFGTQPRDALTSESDITATGETKAGTIIINTPDIDPSSGLIQLPENFVDASSLVDRRCSPSNRASRFVVTGSGGLPASPIAVLGGDAIDVNWVTLPQEKGRGAEERRSRGAEEDNFIVGDRIVEAQGWVKGPNGEVILTATPPTATPHNSWQRPIDCPAPQRQ